MRLIAIVFVMCLIIPALANAVWVGPVTVSLVQPSDDGLILFHFEPQTGLDIHDCEGDSPASIEWVMRPDNPHRDVIIAIATTAFHDKLPVLRRSVFVETVDCHSKDRPVVKNMVYAMPRHDPRVP